MSQDKEWDCIDPDPNFADTWAKLIPTLKEEGMKASELARRLQELPAHMKDAPIALQIDGGICVPLDEMIHYGTADSSIFLHGVSEEGDEHGCDASCDHTLDNNDVHPEG